MALLPDKKTLPSNGQELPDTRAELMTMLEKLEGEFSIASRHEADAAATLKEVERESERAYRRKSVAADDVNYVRKYIAETFLKDVEQ